MKAEKAEKAQAELQVEHIKDLSVLKPASYNPRSVNDVQLRAIARSIAEFGIVDPFIARREDKLILGGHQRLKAVEFLLSGPFRYKGRDGEPITVRWQMPERGLPVIFLEGVDDKRAKLLNLALNRATGDWEHDQLASLLHSLAVDDGLDLNELQLSAFSPAELTDYLDIANEHIELGSGGEHIGNIPAPSTQAPKLSLDFGSKELRDAVKTAIGAQSKGPALPSGDVLARMLGIKVGKKKAVA